MATYTSGFSYVDVACVLGWWVLNCGGYQTTWWLSIRLSYYAEVHTHPATVWHRFFYTDYFNVPYQFTPFLNMCSLSFSLTPFGWLCSTMLNLSFRWKYHFLFMPLWLCPLFHECNYGIKHRLHVLWLYY